MRKHLAVAALPIGILAVVLTLEAAAILKLVPSQGDLIKLVGIWLAYHGTYAIAGISFVENIAGISIYFPGSLAILTSMAATSGNLYRASLVWLAITLGAIFGQLVNFEFGKSSSRRTELGEQHTIRPIVFFSTFWHPQFASVTSLKSGQSGINSRKFLILMIPNLLFWNGVWGGIMYQWGNVIGDSEGWSALFVAYLIAWIAYELHVSCRKY
jgi:membrane protein DedA with SNARE-associated domain